MPIPKAVKTALLIASFLFASPLWAEPATASSDDCSEVRMDQGEGSVSKMPVLDQGDEGLCYSYTASQLIDAWRFSHGDANTKALSSPVYGASLYAKDDKKKYAMLNAIKGEIDQNQLKLSFQSRPSGPFERMQQAQNAFTETNIGHVSAVLERLRQNRYTCNTSDIMGPRLQKEFSQKIEPVIELAKKIYRNDGKKMGAENKAQMICNLENAFPMAHGTRIFPDIQNLIEKSQNPNELLVNILDSLCKTKIDLSKLPAARTLLASNVHENEKLKKMKELLSKPQPQPVGIDYCSSVLFTKAPPRCDPHSSLVIGRKKIKGQCHFLVRNSWGKKCQFMRDGRPTKYQYQCDEKGQIWVPAEELVKEMTQLTWLE